MKSKVWFDHSRNELLDSAKQLRKPDELTRADATAMANRQKQRFVAHDEPTRATNQLARTCAPRDEPTCSPQCDELIGGELVRRARRS